MSLSKNIRYLRKKNNWSQDILAEKLGYKSYTTIQKWEMGTSEPPLKTLKVLAELFNVDMHDLANVDLESTILSPYTPSESTRIPVYGCIPAGVPLEAIECIEGYIDIPDEWIKSGDEYFGLKVKGNSMYPKYMDGDLIILRRQSDCESGQDAAVRVNGDDATLKKVIKQQFGIMLQPINPEYEPRMYEYNDENYPIEIMGVVVQLRRDV